MMAQTTDRTLFYFPGSFYSWRAVLALLEKQVPFNERLVNISTGEQLTDSYLKINPKGLVPVLKDGDKLIPESDDIIDYLDRAYCTGSNLVPDESSELGRDVKHLREYLNTIKIEIVTYGIFLHRHFSIAGLRFKGLVDLFINKKNIAHKFSSSIRNIDAKLAKTSDPVLIEALQKKRAFDIDFRDTIQDPDKVAAILDGLDPVFDQLEIQLKTSQKIVAADTNYFLFGPSFTVADIAAATLLLRLYQLGVDERYYSATKRPLVHAYNVRLLARPNVVKIKELSDSTFSFLVRGKVKTVAIKSVNIALVTGLIGLGAYGVWTFCNRNT